MIRPRLLDLFCGAGGAAMGYHRAGFEIMGVDHKPQPRYLLSGASAFILADALEYVREHGREYDAIHASPPCQAYSIMRNLPWLRDKEYPRLIDPTREALTATGKPWLIENVMGAKLAAGWLCGGMFGLPFYRHRAFETNWFWLQPGHPRHEFTVRNGRMMGARARDIVHAGAWQRTDNQRRGSHLSLPIGGNGAQRIGANLGHAAGVGLAREVMGIPWMSRDEITQAIPPAYTEWIGKQLMTVVRRTVE